MENQYEEEFVLSPMSAQTMQRIGVLLDACKKFGVDYASASEKEKCFVDEYARYVYERRTAGPNARDGVEPFFGCPRASA